MTRFFCSGCIIFNCECDYRATPYITFPFQFYQVLLCNWICFRWLIFITILQYYYPFIVNCIIFLTILTGLLDWFNWRNFFKDTLFLLFSPYAYGCFLQMTNLHCIICVYFIIYDRSVKKNHTREGFQLRLLIPAQKKLRILINVLVCVVRILSFDED